MLFVIIYFQSVTAKYCACTFYVQIILIIMINNNIIIIRKNM